MHFFSSQVLQDIVANFVSSARLTQTELNNDERSQYIIHSPSSEFILLICSVKCLAFCNDVFSISGSVMLAKFL